MLVCPLSYTTVYMCPALGIFLSDARLISIRISYYSFERYTTLYLFKDLEAAESSLALALDAWTNSCYLLFRCFQRQLY